MASRLHRRPDPINVQILPPSLSIIPRVPFSSPLTLPPSTPSLHSTASQHSNSCFINVIALLSNISYCLLQIAFKRKMLIDGLALCSLRCLSLLLHRLLAGLASCFSALALASTTYYWLGFSRFSVNSFLRFFLVVGFRPPLSFFASSSSRPPCSPESSPISC